MSTRSATIALIVALGASGAPGSSGLRAHPPDHSQAGRNLLEMLTPSPEVERYYAIALEIWKRETAALAPSTGK
jgi:hypothetical protein